MLSIIYNEQVEEISGVNIFDAIDGDLANCKKKIGTWELNTICLFIVKFVFLNHIGFNSRAPKYLGHYVAG